MGCRDFSISRWSITTDAHTFSALGFIGDIMPYAALGAGLRSAGQLVSSITSENFGALLMEKGLESNLIPGGAEQLVTKLLASVSDHSFWDFAM